MFKWFILALLAISPLVGDVHRDLYDRNRRDARCGRGSCYRPSYSPGRPGYIYDPNTCCEAESERPVTEENIYEEEEFEEEA